MISACSLSNLSFKGLVNDYNAHFISHKLNKKAKCPPIRKSLFNSPSFWSQDGSPTYKMKSWRNSLLWWIFQTLTPSLRVHHPERFWSQESRPFYKVTHAGEFRACQKLFSLQHSLPLWCEEYNLWSDVWNMSYMPHPRLSRSTSGLWNLKVNVDWGENVFVSTRVF